MNLYGFTSTYINKTFHNPSLIDSLIESIRHTDIYQTHRHTHTNSYRHNVSVINNPIKTHKKKQIKRQNRRKKTLLLRKMSCGKCDAYIQKIHNYPPFEPSKAANIPKYFYVNIIL